MTEQDPPRPTPELEAIFEHARAIADAAERSAYLDRTCPADHRVEIEALLAAADAGNAKMDRLVNESTTLMWTSIHHPGTIIGPYELVSPLGEGGFGDVWRARQTEPIRRDVALKLIKPGMDAQQVLRRFAAERRTLASMDHPNVARLLDVGLTDAGRPYFAMELVDGESIVRYCDARRLSTADRLQLFTSVCRAIQHAHQKGVIHRDIKPSNVLVAEHDGVAIPKVIDFGIARAFEDDGAERTRFTEGGQLLGTPGYMSPEQAAMEPDLVDTRSDVYSLGVLLYELLVGRPPFEAETLRRAGIAEMLRIIRENDPPRPSTRIMTLGPASGEIADARRTTPNRIRHELDGELDWIVMQCLAKERERRYDSASALADDVERALRHEPVVAGPPSWSYRARTFLRRHRVGASVGATVAATLVLGTIGTTLGFLRAEAGWASARENAARAIASDEASQRSLYVALMQLASEAAALPDPVGAQRLLESAPEQHRGWEHAHLLARTAPIGLDLEPPWWVMVLADPARGLVHAAGRGVLAWHADDGRLAWRVDPDPATEGLSRRSMLLRSEDGSRLLHALEIWSHAPERPHRDASHRWVHVTILDAATGAVLHELEPFPGRVPPAGPAVVGDPCPLLVDSGGEIRLLLIDLQTGTVASDRRLGPWPTSETEVMIAPGGRHVLVHAGDPPAGKSPRGDLESSLRIIRTRDARDVPTSAAAATTAAAAESRFKGRGRGFLGPDRFVLDTDRGPMVVRFDAREDDVAELEAIQVSPLPVEGPAAGLMMRFARPGWVGYDLGGGGARVHDVEQDRWFDVPASGESVFGGSTSDVDFETGRLVAAWPGGVRMLDLGLPRALDELRRVTQGVREIEPLADGRRLVATDWTGFHEAAPGSLVLLDATTGEVLHQWLAPGAGTLDIAVHPTDPVVYSWSRIFSLDAGAPGSTVKLMAWNADTGAHLWTAPATGGFQFGLHVTESGRLLVHGDRRVDEFDPADGTRIGDPLPGPTTVDGMLPLPGDRVLLLDETDRAHAVVDLATRLIVREFALELPRGSASRLAVHPEGRLVAIGAVDRPVVHVIDIESGTLVARPGPQSGSIGAVAFHPGGTRLATGGGDGRVRLFAIDADAGATDPPLEFVGSIPAHDRLVCALAWSGDGTVLYSAGIDGAVKRWGLETRPERLAALRDLQATAELVDAWLRSQIQANGGIVDPDVLLARIDAQVAFDEGQRQMARMRIGRHLPRTP